MAESAEEAEAEESEKQQHKDDYADDVEEIVLSDDELDSQHSHNLERQQKRDIEDDDEVQVYGARRRKRRQQQQRTQHHLTVSSDDEPVEEQQRTPNVDGDEDDDELTIISTGKRRKGRALHTISPLRPHAATVPTNSANQQPFSALLPTVPTVPAPTRPAVDTDPRPPPRLSTVAATHSSAPSSTSSSDSSIRSIHHHDSKGLSHSSPSMQLLSASTSSASPVSSSGPSLARFAELSPEPPMAPDVVRIQCRLPGGSTVQRRFLADSSAASLHSFVQHSLQRLSGDGSSGGTGQSHFRVLSTHPRREVELLADKDATLQSLHVGNTTLVIEWTD